LENSPFPDEYKKAREALLLFDISEREATIYFTILFKGESKASEIATKLGMHRLDVYHELKSLQSKDMVESTISKPMKFKAIQLDTVVENLRKQQADSIRARTEALSSLQKSSEEFKFSNLKENESNVHANKIQIISGQRAIAEKWANLLSHAKSEILVAAIDRGSAKLLLMREMDEISKKINAGVNVRIFTPMSNTNTGQFKEIASEVRHLDSINSAGVCIVDRSEVMIIPEASPGESGFHFDETAILITSASIVEMFRVLFFVGWDTSPSMGTSE
jgi:sugar-specific transcriptional regulator TrmB